MFLRQNLKENLRDFSIIEGKIDNMEQIKAMCGKV